ncbi:hypothetical protein RMSM_05296 [Rhodopirellula maiorica SM1]|uniref:Uncharacterized protein n=1 Tax=Rhodopirellula maiorica SM1 TaxID=1265738 RepID=M5REG8_9BACT|nr:hypothetical protein [Rhodopirellula maiorica]EMI17770.1 hypothetical protein RMSM_05296 [Rhodopirellula maiorica SM1]
MRKMLALIALVVCCGCNELPQRVTTLPIKRVVETPAANLPTSLRPYNWTDARGSGSCVNASTVYNLTWSAKPELAAWWRKNHAGGETDTSIRRSHDAVGLRYYYTRNADPEFLKWVTKTRRSALIWYYQSHCVNFVGFHRDPTRPDDSTMYAWLCDNNRPTRYIKVPIDSFLRKWAGYGGFGLALKDPPVPPSLFSATTRS